MQTSAAKGRSFLYLRECVALTSRGEEARVFAKECAPFLVEA